MNKVRWLILICMILAPQKLTADVFMRGVGSDGSFDVAQLTDLGADSVRPHISWRSIEPNILDASLTVAAVDADPDLVSNYAGDWGATDDLINLLADNGFLIIPRIGYGATIYLPSIGGDAATPDTLGTEYYLGCVYRHVRAAVRRYKDRVHHWVIEGEQNEAQLAVLFGWRSGTAWSNPTFLTDLTATIHDAVRIEDPGAEIAIAFHTDIHENIHDNFILSLTAGPYSWTEWLEEWDQYLDIVALDCYPNYYNADPVYGMDVGARVAAAKAIAPGKSVIVLETAYPVPVPGVTLPDPVDYTEAKQAQYVGDAVNSVIANGADGFFYFSLKSNGMQDLYTQQDLDALAILGPAFHDGDTAALIAFLSIPGNIQYCTNELVIALQNVESGFGLIRSDDSRRPGFDVLQAVFSGDINRPPTASNLTIAPGTPVTGDDLTGDYDFDDVDGDSNSSVIKWYKNDDEQTAYGGVLTVPSSATAKGQEWYFTVEPNDGTDSGALEQSSTVTISNTPPTADNLTIDPETPATGDDLTGDYDFNDVDGDSDNSLIKWYKNDNEQTAYGGTLTVPSSATAEGQEWYFTVEPNDGTASGLIQQLSTVTIGNTPPTASDPSIDPSAPLTGDNLEANYTYEDVDGDEQSNSEIRWYKNDERQAAYDNNTTVLSAATSKGETWYFTLQPGDGAYLGDLVTSPTVTIGNTPPALATASISSDTSPAVETSVLTASADGWSDADGDAEDYRYQWYNQSGAIASVAGSSLDSGIQGSEIAGATDPTLDGSFFDRDDEIYCIITPFDGTDEGAPVESNHITVDNSPPAVSAVSITPNPPKATDNLTLNYTYSDVDDDAEAGTQIRWYKDGVQQIAYNDQKTVLSADTAKNQEWFYTLRPNDGTDFGPAAVGSVSIMNSPPVADAGDAHLAEPNEEVLFDGSGSSDADGDPLSYSWTFGDGDTGSGVAPAHTYTANGAYDVLLEVNDGEAISDPAATVAYISDSSGTQQIIELDSDWTLISIYLQPLNSSLEIVLASILDDLEAVWAYNAEAQEWRCRIIDGPTYPNDLGEVVPGVGYWIKMKRPGTLIVQGTEPATAIVLYVGLNIVGYSSDVSRAIVDCVSFISYNSVRAYDAEQKIWLQYSPYAPGFLNSLGSMNPGSGYVIDVDVESVWELP